DERLAGQRTLGAQVLHGVGEGDVGAGDRRSTRAAVGLQHVTVERGRVFAARLILHGRAQRPPDDARALMRTSADAALDRLTRRAVVRGLREHRVLGGDPAEARTLAPTGYALARARCAQHLGLAELDQAGALRVVEPVAGDGHGAE